MNSDELPALILSLIVVGFIAYLVPYTGLRGGKAFLAMVAGILVSVVYVTLLVNPRSARADLDTPEAFLSLLSAGVAILLAPAFAFRLWGRWVGEKATPEELLPGLAGVRAWFGAGNVAVGTALVLTAWLGFDVPLLVGAVAIGALLAAAPLLRMESSPAVAITRPGEYSPEREKIVSMLDAGKLTPAESTQLLQALGGSGRPSCQGPLTSGQRLMLTGAALVVVGFFLPWFVFNPGNEGNRMINQTQFAVGSTGDFSMPPGAPALPNALIKTPSVTISGGDIQRGLGWAALAFAIATAFLPYLAATLEMATARTFRVLSLGAGGLILLYLLTQNLRSVGIGLVLAAVGYIVETVGLVRESRVAATPPGGLPGA